VLVARLWDERRESSTSFFDVETDHTTIHPLACSAGILPPRMRRRDVPNPRIPPAVWMSKVQVLADQNVNALSAMRQVDKNSALIVRKDDSCAYGSQSYTDFVHGIFSASLAQGSFDMATGVPASWLNEPGVERSCFLVTMIIPLEPFDGENNSNTSFSATSPTAKRQHHRPRCRSAFYL
jgi:hypothetical protein